MTDTPRKRGRPPGSPNKRPKPTMDLSNPAEARIAKNLDAVVDSLVDAAVVKGDVSAAKYLIDRLLGKATERVDIQQQTEQRIVVEYPDDWRKAN